MTGATRTSCAVLALAGRVFSPGVYRQIINGVVISLGAVAAVCAPVTIVTVAAAWLFNAALATNANLHVSTTVAHINRFTTIAGATDFLRVSRPADAMTFEVKWARAMASVPTRTGVVILVPEHPVERANNVAAMQASPLGPPRSSPVASESTHPSMLVPPTLIPERANKVSLPRPHSVQREIAFSPSAKGEPQVAASPPPAPEKQVVAQEGHNKARLQPDPDNRTAVYDISARTVYLPNGEKLEAHSGLGDKRDDPQYVHVRMRGPTPPNVYDLTLREKLFHGVRAIRLNPVDDSKMFGRDGILAHSYMLGSNGQSNGCVSFKDYPKFLQAFLNGEVERLVVVPNLGTEPSRAARAGHRHVGLYALNNQ
jgi:hypothetical protein